MKLVIAVVQDQDVPELMDSLVEKGFRATKLASTGGFLRLGNTTLLIGIEDWQIDDVIEIVRTTCRTRSRMVAPTTPVAPSMGPYASSPVEVQIGGGTIFVLDVVRFEKV